MKWIKKIMQGRYGGDQLSMYLLIVSILFTIIGRLSNIQMLGFVGYIPLFIGIFRMFSKDISKRSMENYKFAIFISPIYTKFKKIQNRLKGSKTHKYYKCPSCNTELRMPKGKGKVIITCPKCKTKFEKRT